MLKDCKEKKKIKCAFIHTPCACIHTSMCFHSLQRMISGKTYHPNYTLVLPAREVADSLQRGNPDVNEWMQNDWETKTRQQCWQKFTLPIFASFLISDLLKSFAGKRLFGKKETANKQKTKVKRRPDLNIVFLVFFWCTTC